MRRFFNGTDTSFAALEQRARACAFVNFPNTELPPGFHPARVRTGLKIDHVTGAVTFYVERGVRYDGARPSISQWVQDGQSSFPDMQAFRHWLARDWKNEFAGPPPSIPPDAIGQPADPKLPARRSKKAPAGTRAEPRDGSETFVPALVDYLVKGTAKNYGVEVFHIDQGVIEELQKKLSISGKDITCDMVADDLLGGVFAVASVEGHRVVAVHAGPPIKCTPKT